MPRFFLRTLGGLALIRDDETAAGAAVQRKRLILLAVIAANGQAGGVSRDHVLALLWPESDQTRARNALNQALFALRRDMGGEAVTGTLELKLDPGILQCDVIELLRANDRRDASAVVERYTGPFLDGVFAPQEVELNAWIERMRSAIDDVFRASLQTLAAKADADGERAAAVLLWRRLAAVAPFSAPVACALMRALAASGDRAGALAHARVYERLVAGELGIEPDPTVTALVAHLAMPTETAVVLVKFPARAPSADEPMSVSHPPSVAAGVRRIRAAAIGVAMVVLAATGFIYFGPSARSRRLAAAPVLSTDRDPVVFPFRVDIADSSLSFLGEGIADLLSAALAQQGGAVPADAHSLAIAWREASSDLGGIATLASRAIRRVGATRAILGTIVGDRTRINVSAEIISESGKIETPVVQTSGSPDSILAIVDRLASALLAGQASQDPRRLADLTTRSPAALRDYLRALSAVRAGENARALNAFLEAMHTDTSFALAALGVATTGGWADRTLADRAKNDFALGWRLRSRLEPQERSLFDAAVGSYNPTDDTDLDNIARWQEAMRTAPGRADVVYGFADRLFHTGSSVGIADADQRAVRAFSSAVRMDSSQLVALEHLIELAISRGDLSGARRDYRAYLTRDSRSDGAAYLGWRITVASGSNDEQRSLRSRFAQFSDGSLRRVTGFSQIDGIAIGDGARALEVLTARGENEHEHILTLFRRHAFALNTADTAAAGRALDALAASPEWSRDEAANLGDALDLGVTDALFSIGDRPRALRSLAAMRTVQPRERGGIAQRHACTAEIWRTAHGDTSRTARTVRALTDTVADGDSAKFYGWQPRICLAGLTAELSLARHAADAGHAVARFDSLVASGPRGYGMMFENLWVSRMFQRVGEPSRSLAAVSRRHRNWDEVLYLADMDVVVAKLSPRFGTVRQLQVAEARLRVFRGPAGASRLH